MTAEIRYQVGTRAQASRTAHRVAMPVRVTHACPLSEPSVSTTINRHHPCHVVESRRRRNVSRASLTIGCTALLSAGFLGCATPSTPSSSARNDSQIPQQDSERYVTLGQQLVNEGRHAEAAQVFQQAAFLSQQAVAAEHERAMQAVLSEQNTLQAERRQLAQKTLAMRQAVEAERRGDTRRALTFWQKAGAIDPQDRQVQKAIASLQPRPKSRSRPMTRRARDADNEVSTQPVVAEYRVSVGDLLEVFVWQQPDLTRDVVVRPDGRLSFPLVGDVEAAGTTLTQLDAALTERLKIYIRYPDVSLSIKRFGGTKTIVMGEVGRPGIYIPSGEGRVLDVIAMAGGLLPKAESTSVMIVRGGLASPQVIKVDLQRILSYGDLKQNIPLQPDDIVYVPKTAIANVFQFLEQFYPALDELLVSQQIATNFGVRETSGGITR